MNEANTTKEKEEEKVHQRSESSIELASQVSDRSERAECNEETPYNTDTEAQRKEPGSDNPNEGVYSILSRRQKRVIVIMASLAAFFSPLTANIYMPGLTTIAKDLSVSNSKINLSVTTYLIMQGIAPTFIGDFSDHSGRRPAYLTCFIIYIAANIGLGLQNNYAALMVLRAVQSTGSSGTVALATAVVTDIITSSERGSYVSYVSIPSLLGPSISPVIGGLLTNYTDWHWIFWFLVILSGVYSVPFIILFPETCRNVTGDGSILPPKWNMTLPQFLKYRRDKSNEEVNAIADVKIRIPRPWTVLEIISQPVAAVLLVQIGIIFIAFYAITTSASQLYSTLYGYSDIKVSLLFLPIGGGGIISTFTTGRILDWNFRRHAQKIGLIIDKTRQQNLLEFPIERARLEVTIPASILGIICMILLGWVLEHRLSIAGPCVLLAVIGYTLIVSFSSLSILLVEFNRTRAATSTAASNFIRCELGAAATAIISPMLKATGAGWCFTFFALLWLASLSSSIVLIKKGQKWRKRTAQKIAQKAAQKAAKTSASSS
ncbi:citrate synthase [Dipodascopsis uninucleata]